MIRLDGQWPWLEGGPCLVHVSSFQQSAPSPRKRRRRNTKTSRRFFFSWRSWTCRLWSKAYWPWWMSARRRKGQRWQLACIGWPASCHSEPCGAWVARGYLQVPSNCCFLDFSAEKKRKTKYKAVHYILASIAAQSWILKPPCWWLAESSLYHLSRYQHHEWFNQQRLHRLFLLRQHPRCAHQFVLLAVLKNNACDLINDYG